MILEYKDKIEKNDNKDSKEDQVGERFPHPVKKC